MNSQNLIEDLERNIAHQIRKIETLYKQRCITNIKYLNETFHPAQEIDKGNSLFNQALSDAILNSMASLIDYYCICCMLKIGVPESKVRKIQYRPINNRLLIEKSNIKKPKNETVTIEKLREIFISKLSELPEHESIKGHDYWMGFLGNAISHTLKEYGALDSSLFELIYSDPKGRLEIDPKVEKYYFYMLPLFCNPANSSGVKHNIYIDINNFLKHNAVPYLSAQIENLQGEHRVFSYFEIKNSHSHLLKDGILKDLATASFEEMKANLETKSSSIDGYEYLCELENAWGLGGILTLDNVNGYINHNQNLLHFYVDGVLIAKNKDTILIDADKSLLYALSELNREICRGLKLTF